MLPLKLSHPKTGKNGDAVLVEMNDDAVGNGRDYDKEVIIDLVAKEVVNSPQLIVDSSASIITSPRLSNLSKSVPSYFLKMTNYITLLVASIQGTHNIELLTSTKEKKKLLIG